MRPMRPAYAAYAAYAAYTAYAAYMVDGICRMDDAAAYDRWPTTYRVEEEQFVKRGRGAICRADGLGERAVQCLSHAALVQRLHQK